MNKQIQRIEEETIRSLKLDLESNRGKITEVDRTMIAANKELKGLVVTECGKVNEDCLAHLESLKKEQLVLDSKLKGAKNKIADLQIGS